MISVASVVSQIVSEDALILQMLEAGLLNVSAYAKQILPEVEDLAKKPVHLGTIVVALSRLAKNKAKQQEFNPLVKIDRFSVTSNLVELTYDKTDAVMTEVSGLNTGFIDDANVFFAMTMGVNEVTIICSDSIKPKIEADISIKPKALLKDLVAVSVRFGEDLIEVPNTIYSLVGALAVRQINIMEIVSTYTELTFVVYANELETTIQALNTYSKRRKKTFN